jgi:hypothetical protein
MANANWFASAFGVAVDEARYAIADARSKLIDEGWFGRKTPESQRGNDLGWTRPVEEKAREPEPSKPEREHGIDR